MTSNDTNKGTTMNATKANLIAKLQAYADTLDIRMARVEIGQHAHDMNVIWLCFCCIGCEPEKISVGLVKSGIRRIKARMQQFEASLA